MINFESFVLDNGLRVYFHEDHTTPTAVVNVLYDVGSKDEDEDMTGFAHLFEHLMFGGSRHIPSYDQALQKVGGENNAFTSPDITNYYISLPMTNLETAFWLESDRMLGLSFDPEVLEVQRKVVIEEFKQRYLNQPYGDVWMKLRPLCYQVHPYQWATIGKDISHIEKVKMEDVKAFFYRYYVPNNAILVVAGNTDLETVKQLSQKWFGDIPAGPEHTRQLQAEPVQDSARFLEMESDVPLDALYKAYHMPARIAESYHTADLLSDILGRGKSSRLYTELVKEKRIFNSLSAYVTGSADPGLLVVQGNLNQGQDLEVADQAVQEVIQELILKGLEESELQKVKNKAEATLAFTEVELLNRCIHLAFQAAIGQEERVNQESARIQAVNREELLGMAQHILREVNSSTLYYRKNAS